MALPGFKGIRYYVMNMDERRKHKRYNVQQGTFAAFSSNYLVGQIKNISMGGVSFYCIASSRKSNSNTVLEIFSKDINFYLRKISFKVISEIDVGTHIPWSSLPMKQISGEFAELTEYQKAQLDFFLQNLTATEA
jgi:hypothetical protein